MTCTSLTSGSPLKVRSPLLRAPRGLLLPLPLLDHEPGRLSIVDARIVAPLEEHVVENCMGSCRKESRPPDEKVV